MNPQILLDTEYGELKCESVETNNGPIIVIFNDDYDGVPLVRLHSSCLFSEALHSIDCDCAPQLNAALKYITQNGGYILYHYQEGRGVGIHEKIKAISIQQSDKLNTVEAFKRLGHSDDCRSFTDAAEILKDRGVTEITLDTSNPLKIKALEGSGIKVNKRVRLPIISNNKIDTYLAEKLPILGHHENN